MTHEETLREYERLRAKGITSREAVERLGVSRTTLLRWVDPGYAQRCRDLSRAAKQRLRGTCVDCGAATAYNGKTNRGASVRCTPCANARVGRQRRGSGSTGSRILEFLTDEPHTWKEIREHLGTTRGNCSNQMNRLVRYGLVRRVKRGLYERAEPAMR